MNIPNHQLADGQSSDPEVIVFNLKKRYTGVSATVNSLLPLQLKQWNLAYCGTLMSNGIQGMSLARAIKISRQPPPNRKFRIWHVRRNHEMSAGIFARDVLRLPIKLVFTSSAKHLHSRLPRRLIAQMDAVIATTDVALACLTNPIKVVVPHGIDLSRFAVPADKLNIWSSTKLAGKYAIGTFGRVRAEKGSAIFVQAMLQALPLLPAATAIIAGLCQAKDKKLLATLKQQIAAAGLTDRIIFLGEIPAAEVALWYQRCLVCVACPLYEPFGLTPFEAAAAGCALVCSRTGAFADLVEDDINGQLVPTGDANALAQAVIKLFANGVESVVAKGLLARDKVVNNFSLAQEAAGIGKLYEQLFNATN